MFIYRHDFKHTKSIDSQQHNAHLIQCREKKNQLAKVKRHSFLDNSAERLSSYFMDDQNENLTSKPYCTWQSKMGSILYMMRKSSA